MKAVFKGGLVEGFSLVAVANETEAEEIVIRYLANGTLAEAIPIEAPSALEKREEDYEEGGFYTLFERGFGNGVSCIYGPFPDHESATEFGERNRGDDDQWSVFQKKN